MKLPTNLAYSFSKDLTEESSLQRLSPWPTNLAYEIAYQFGVVYLLGLPIWRMKLPTNLA